MPMKTCSTCKTELSLEAFSVNPHGRFGRNTVCKSCHKAYAKAYYQENRDRALQQNKQWRADNPEKVRTMARKHQAASRRKHPARINAATAARKDHVTRATAPWANHDDIRMWYEVASVLSRSGVQFHVDHIIPLRGKSVSGLHVEDNLTVMPAWRNVRKSNSITLH